MTTWSQVPVAGTSGLRIVTSVRGRLGEREEAKARDGEVGRERPCAAGCEEVDGYVRPAAARRRGCGKLGGGGHPSRDGTVSHPTGPVTDRGCVFPRPAFHFTLRAHAPRPRTQQPPVAPIRAPPQPRGMVPWAFFFFLPPFSSAAPPRVGGVPAAQPLPPVVAAASGGTTRFHQSCLACVARLGSQLHRDGPPIGRSRRFAEPSRPSRGSGSGGTRPPPHHARRTLPR